MTTAKAAAAQLLVARESTPGAAPSTGWVQLQPNPGGIQNFHSEGVFVARNPLSPYMTPEKGLRVGEDAAPVLVHDFNKDFLDAFGEGFTRSRPLAPGNKGVATYRPTAVTSTGYTVAAEGDLTAGLLVYARGFTTPANNGLKVVASSSTSTEIKASGLSAETPSGPVTLEPCGIQGASGDYEIDASGNIICTTEDFTTVGFHPGQEICIGGATTATQFASLGGPVYATIESVAAKKLTLAMRSWTPGAADDGAGKTIQLITGRLYRNVPDGHQDYVEPSWHGELRDSGVGAGNAEIYSYLPQMVMNSISLAMPVEAKIEATVNFLARKVTEPVEAGSRIVGPSSALAPLATDALHTSCSSLIYHRIVNATDGSTLIAEVNECTLTVNHNITPRKELGACGATGMIFGSIVPQLDMETYFERAAVPKAIANDTTCSYKAIAKNGQFGVAIRFPGVTLQGGGKTYAENSPVMMTIASPAHRVGTTIMTMTVFPYLP